jgi:hypothetical protein
MESNDENSNNEDSNNENVWKVNTDDYIIKPGNNGNVKVKPGKVNYLSVIAATPKKQIKRNPYNQHGPVMLGYKGVNPKTPERPIRGRSVNRRRTHKSRARFEPSPPPIERLKRSGQPLNAPNQKRSKGGKRKTIRRRK